MHKDFLNKIKTVLKTTSLKILNKVSTFKEHGFLQWF